MKGFSLVELILALLIFQVGLLATAGLILTSQKDLVRAELTLIGTLEADLVADSLQKSGDPGPGNKDYLWGRVSWGQQPDEMGGFEVVAFSNLLGDTLVSLRVDPFLDHSPSSWEGPARTEGGG